VESLASYCEQGSPRGDARGLQSFSRSIPCQAAAEYRAKIPESPNGRLEWSERSVRELTRIPNKRQAAKVALETTTPQGRADDP
jgi:hypothetical protein